jgi:hypothetical protein
MTARAGTVFAALLLLSCTGGTGNIGDVDASAPRADSGGSSSSSSSSVRLMTSVWPSI